MALPSPAQRPLAPLISALGEDPRRAIDRLAGEGFRYVQLSATQPGLRPRELDQSARRDLLAVLRRHEISPAGLDLWIPAEHFLDDAHVARAVDATISAIVLAGALGRVPLSMNLPAPGTDTVGQVASIMDSVSAAAQQHGVAIANHTVPPPDTMDETVGLGIDPAAWLSQGLDPATVVSTHAAHLVAARLSDLNAAGMRCPIGESSGRLDVTAYQVALSIAGYQRPVVLDARQWSQPWAGILQTANEWVRTSPGV